jgi:hypothetical protein
MRALPYTALLVGLPLVLLAEKDSTPPLERDAPKKTETATFALG